MNFQKLFPKIVISTFLFLTFLINSCEKKKETTITNQSFFKKQQVDKYYQLANRYYDNSRFDSAFFYANKTKKLISPKNDFDRYRIIMHILAMSQQIQADYSSAENTLVETITTIENLGKNSYQYKFYNMLAYNYSLQNNYNEALKYYYYTLKHKVSIKRKLLCYINIGYIFIKKQQYLKASKILEPLLKHPELRKNNYFHSEILKNLGYCYFKLNKPEAINYLNKSLDLEKNINGFADNDYGLTTSYYYLYEYYINSNPKKALNYINLLYQKATEYNNPDDRLIALGLFIKHSKGDQLKKYSLNYVHLNDSITEVRQKAKNYFAKLKYDSKKEKEENLKLKEEKQLQQELERNKNIFITFIIIILILVTTFIYYYLVEKSKKEKIQTAYNTEIRIAKKLHDELANEIYQTMNFAETQDLSSPHVSEKLLENLDSIYATTRNISRENNLIETGSLYKNNLKEMISSFNSKRANILINGLEEIDWKNIGKLKKITLYRVIQELMVNMKKHSKSNLVLISFKKQENNLLLNYYDNGIGINFELTNRKSGLQNIESRIAAINGTITFDSNQNKGVKININIPV